MRWTSLCIVGIYLLFPGYVSGQSFYTDRGEPHISLILPGGALAETVNVGLGVTPVAFVSSIDQIDRIGNVFQVGFNGYFGENSSDPDFSFEGIAGYGTVLSYGVRYYPIQWFAFEAGLGGEYAILTSEIEEKGKAKSGFKYLGYAGIGIFSEDVGLMLSYNLGPDSWKYAKISFGMTLD